MNLKSAVAAINKHGMLLAFPQDNRPEPKSLWSVAYPGEKMRWEWDDSGDSRVARLWHLREKLSRSGEVVYVKWFRGRATFFSKELFTKLLAVNFQVLGYQGLSADARHILDLLEGDSPLSTKALKKASGLTGKSKEAAYERALKSLWSRFYIVGFGEVDEGAFPSLAIGASKVMFEALFDEARAMDRAEAERGCQAFFDANPSAQKIFQKNLLTARPKHHVAAKGKGYIEYNG